MDRLTYHIPVAVLEEVISVFDIGESLHPPGDAWKKEPIEDHIDHAVGHMNLGLLGRKDDETHAHHLTHAICRLMFALALQIKEEEDAL